LKKSILIDKLIFLKKSVLENVFS